MNYTVILSVHKHECIITTLNVPNQGCELHAFSIVNVEKQKLFEEAFLCL